MALLYNNPSKLAVFVSYAREERVFVERFVDVLRRYAKPDRVFTYLDEQGEPPGTINEVFGRFGKLLSGKGGGVPVFVQVTDSRGAITKAQFTELNLWNTVLNDRTAGEAVFCEVRVRLPASAPPRKGKSQVPGQTLGLPRPGTDFVELEPLWVDAASSEWVAERILRLVLFGQHQDVPFAPQLSDYEKTVVEHFRQLAQHCTTWKGEDRKKRFELLKTGFPFTWPTVSLRCGKNFVLDESPLKEREVGKWRQGLDTLVCAPETPQPDAVVASALTNQHEPCMMKQGFTFLEAGPRAAIHKGVRRVAIVVSGGIAPGINAVIDAIVRRHEKYGTTSEIIGIRHGFMGLRDWEPQPLTSAETSKCATEGGSMLETSRLAALLSDDEDERTTCLESMLGSLHQVSILYVIGGEGSMKAAHRLACYARENGRELSIVGIPKTMDNDILWVWQSFGFATAVEKAREIIGHLRTEVSSNPRMCFLQLFGSASGFVVSHAISASRAGQCDVALVPEVKFTIQKLALRLAEAIAGQDGAKLPRPVPYALIVMAEAAIPEDWRIYRTVLSQEEERAVRDYQEYRKAGKYPPGQTTDELRSAQLKLVMHGVMQEVRKLILTREVVPRDNVDIHVKDPRVFRAFANEPRHILRATQPSFADIITGQRLGSLAVDNAMAGYTDFMISQWLTEFVLVPLRLVSLGRKHIPEQGIFWKSVLSKTMQGDLSPDTEG